MPGVTSNGSLVGMVNQDKLMEVPRVHAALEFSGR